MDNDLTELVFVLDRSGSMGGRIGDVIGGFDELIGKQKALPGRASVTLVIFDDHIDLLADGVDINLVAPLSPELYFARGTTALFDAIAVATDRVGRRLAATPDNNRPGKVLVTVMTDGLENASKEYGRHDGGLARLRAKIEVQKTRYSWQYVFIGANQDAVLSGADIGVHGSVAMSFNAHSPMAVRNAMRSVSSYASSYRVSPDVGTANSLAFSDEDRVRSMVGGDDPGVVQDPVAGVIVIPDGTSKP